MKWVRNSWSLPILSESKTDRSEGGGRRRTRRREEKRRRREKKEIEKEIRIKMKKKCCQQWRTIASA